LTSMIKKGQLAEKDELERKPEWSNIEYFVRLNSRTGNKWALAPLSPVEDGFLTFTEIELATFLAKREDLREDLKDLICLESDRRLTQEDITRDWLPYVTPGLFIQRLVSPVAPRGLRGGKKRNAGVATAIKMLTPNAIHEHINMLREQDFDPREYMEKGYILRGSIKTDGHRLQLLAFKVRKLLSVRYKRSGYRSEVPPDSLVSTTAGTGDPLTEARNPRIGGRSHNRHRGCKGDGRRNKGGSRGRRRRGSKQVKEKKPPASAMRHIELFSKQKAVSQPTLKHRAWMEAKKRMPLYQTSGKKGDQQSTNSTTESALQRQTANGLNTSMDGAVQQQTASITPTTVHEQSISAIETAMPPLRGAGACFAGYVKYRRDNKDTLDKFYNGKKFTFKRHKWHARRARQQEYHQLADGLLRMVGGLIGEKRRVEDPVVIGIGLGRFRSTSGLSSLHGTFEGYFTGKARALGYVVVGIKEYYTSKKCPMCHKFVCQTESIRRLYCPNCRKYRHRDVLAGHNMCNILRAFVERQERPDYLQPVDKDGNYPWKEKDGKTKDQPKNVPGPSKRASPGKRQVEEGNSEKADAKKQATRRAKRISTKSKTAVAKSKRVVV
ncbi:hypothetical protein BGZ80_011672, partial [Entomortierella chlamydospora]